MKKYLGSTTIIAISIIPLIRWAVILPFGTRFSGIGIAATSLGQVTGLLGMMLFSLNLVLSGRFKLLDKYFYGLNRMYKVHIFAGAFSFMLLLFHPLLLVVKYISFSLRESALFLLPVGDFAKIFGVASLVGMIVLIFLTFYLKMRYSSWKISHKIMVPVFVFAILHVFSVSSDVSRDVFLKYYILGFAFFGLFAGSYRAFLSGKWNREFEYRVSKILKPAPNIFSFILSPAGRKLPFMPGQFVYARFFGDGISRESHPYSITSSPIDSNVELTIKTLGDFTSTLALAKADDRVMIDGPFGKFSYKNMDEKKQIWIAGGIGITPFLSMARGMEKEDYDIVLYYCVRIPEEAIFLDELENIARSNNNLKIHSWCSAQSGRITARSISRSYPDFAERGVMICGPSRFMSDLSRQFIHLGVDRRRIHREDFNFL
jgi:predicted ferric reductase